MKKNTFPIYRHFYFVFLFVLFLPILLQAGFSFDNQRYIPIDDIKPGMKGYVLSVYSGTNIEKFPIEVVSVVKNNRIGKNAIFVMGTDPRFVHTGPVEGCSGSPVYINGKIAGALAFGWSYSKDPLYGVTPISEMLKVAHGEETTAQKPHHASSKLDVSAGVSLEVAYKSLLSSLKSEKSLATNSFGEIGFPMVTSLSNSACAEIEELGSVFGANLISSDITTVPAEKVAQDCKLKPGAVLAIPLISGDIKMAAIGTVTDVVGDDVLAFGHAFTGRGRVNLPMASGFIHTVVANNVSSFKYGQSLNAIGAIKSDESTAVFGKIGETAPTIPVSITLDRFDTQKPKTYNCKIAVDPDYTPILVQTLISGVALERGGFPIHHTIKYWARINFDDGEALEFNDITSDGGVYQLLKNIVGSVMLLSDNPFHQSVINSIDIKMDLLDEDKMATIWDVEVSKTELKASEAMNVLVTIDTFGSEKFQYDFSVKVPDNAPKGKYMLFVGGKKRFIDFERDNLPYLYKAESFASMIKIIKRLSKERSDEIYCALICPKNGISLETAPLYSLPISKQLPLVDQRHGMRVKKIGKWLVSKKKCGYVVNGMKKIEIKVVE